MEKKVPTGGAFTIESEYSRYNRLGGYDARLCQKPRAPTGWHPSSFPKQVGIGKFELLGKYAIAQFTDGISGQRSYRQNTTEVNFSYIIKQFDARVMSFYRDESFNAVQSNNWEAGVGLQLQISKSFKGSNL